MGYRESIFAKGHRALRKVRAWCTIVCNRLRFKLFGIKFGKNCKVEGKVYLERKDGATISIGNDFHCISGLGINRIGGNLRSGIHAAAGAQILIGDNVGISCSCIWARQSITIGDCARIGAGCIIMDHDAHSLDYLSRRDWNRDSEGIASEPVEIGPDVLLGTRCIVLKGAKIGKGSVIGAGSVVTGEIPAGQVWAGAPAKFIKNI